MTTSQMVPPASIPAERPHALQVAVRKKVGDFDLAVSFAVDSGLAVLFGPSGSGKSLTLGLIAGLLRPDAGRIAINGQLVADAEAKLHVSTQDRRVGMVFQEGLLLPHRTVLDNVAMAVRDIDGRAARRAAASQWLEWVGAADLAKRAPGTLSGGQRQRIALARGLAGRPSVLLLDEPLSALDIVTRRAMRSLIRTVIVASGVPSLLVTHDPDEAEELGDLILDYQYGQVVGGRYVDRHPRPSQPGSGG